jgi:hypothetical protein
MSGNKKRNDKTKIKFKFSDMNYHLKAMPNYLYNDDYDNNNNLINNNLNLPSNVLLVNNQDAKIDNKIKKKSKFTFLLND